MNDKIIDIKEVFDIAIIEVITWIPHIGTAYEIAVREKKKGKKVVFFYIKNSAIEENWGCNIDQSSIISKRIEDLNKALDYYNIPFIEYDSLQFEEINLAKSKQIYAEISNLSSNQIMKYVYDDIEIGKSLMSSLISFTNKLKVLPSDYENESINLLNSALSVSNCVNLILEKYKFNLVYSFNGRFTTCKPIFNKLKSKGIPFMTHERGGDFSRFDIFNGFPHEIELIKKMVLNEKASFFTKIVKTYNYFKNQRKGKDHAWLSFINHQTDKNWEIDSKGKRIITFYSSSDFEFEALSDLWPHTLFNSQFEAIKWLIDYMKIENKYFLVVKMHPNQQKLVQNELEEWTAFNSENVKVILPDSTINSYSVMEKSDIIIGYGSTICMESSYWGKKAISVMQSYYSSKTSPVVNEPEDLIEFKNLLDNSDTIKLFPFKNYLNVGYWISSHGYKFKYYKPFNFFEGKFNYYKPYDIFKGRFSFLR